MSCRRGIRLVTDLEFNCPKRSPVRAEAPSAVRSASDVCVLSLILCDETINVASIAFSVPRATSKGPRLQLGPIDRYEYTPASQHVGYDMSYSILRPDAPSARIEAA